MSNAVPVSAVGRRDTPPLLSGCNALSPPLLLLCACTLLLPAAPLSLTEGAAAAGDLADDADGPAAGSALSGRACACALAPAVLDGDAVGTVAAGFVAAAAAATSAATAAAIAVIAACSCAAIAASVAAACMDAAVSMIICFTRAERDSSSCARIVVDGGAEDSSRLKVHAIYTVMDGGGVNSWIKREQWARNETRSR